MNCLDWGVGRYSSSRQKMTTSKLPAVSDFTDPASWVKKWLAKLYPKDDGVKAATCQ